MTISLKKKPNLQQDCAFGIFAGAYCCKVRRGIKKQRLASAACLERKNANAGEPMGLTNDDKAIYLDIGGTAKNALGDERHGR
jgi:hypothetical protein